MASLRIDPFLIEDLARELKEQGGFEKAENPLDQRIGAVLIRIASDQDHGNPQITVKDLAREASRILASIKDSYQSVRSGQAHEMDTEELRLQLGLMPKLATRMGAEPRSVRGLEDTFREISKRLEEVTNQSLQGSFAVRMFAKEGEALDMSHPSNGYALWHQIFRPSIYAQQPIAGNDRQRFFRYLIENHELLATTARHLDFRGVIDKIQHDLYAMDSVGGLAPVFEKTKQGEDNFLARIVDGLCVAHLIQIHTKHLKPGESLDLKVHYAPLWYALNLARDEVRRWEGASKLVAYFDQAEGHLQRIHQEFFGKKAPKVYSRKNFDKLKALPRFKVGYAFYSTQSPDFQDAVVKNLPEGISRMPLYDPILSKPPAVEALVPDFDEVHAKVTTLAKEWNEDYAIYLRKPTEMVLELFRFLGISKNTSPAATLHLLIAFLIGGTALWASGVKTQLVKKATGKDPDWDLFNTILARLTQYLVKTAGTNMAIDEESIIVIVKAVTQARSQNRQLLITSTHESYVDILAIAALLAKFGVRFTYKDALKWLPILGWIPPVPIPGTGVLGVTDMVAIDRPNQNGDTHTRGMVLAGAIFQGDQVAKKRQNDGAMNVDFTPGTRSKVGGVGPAKKGAANQAVDNDALILVLSLDGTREVMSRDWLKTLTGIGINKDVRIHAAVVDPRDNVGNPDLHPFLARKNQVQQVTDSVFEKQIQMDLQSREEANVRVQLISYLHGFVPGFILLDYGKEEDFLQWCKHHKVAPEYVQRLRAWLPNNLVQDVYAESDRIFPFLAFYEDRFWPWKGRKIVTAPLSTSMYARKEVLKFSGSTLPAKAKAIGRFLKHWVSTKLLDQPYPAVAEPVHELIPDSARLDPTSSRSAEIFSHYKSFDPIQELPEELSVAIGEAYGLTSVGSDFEDFALRYLNFILADGVNFSRLYAREPRISREDVDKKESAYRRAFAAMRWNGKPMDEFIFSVLREVREADMISDQSYPANFYGEVPFLFASLCRAEKQLEAALVGKKADDPEVLALRRKVAQAFDAYATAAGLGASSHTFEYLHLFGRAIPHHLFLHVMRSVENRVRPKEMEALFNMHAALDANIKEITIDKTFRPILRGILDRAELARTIQAELLRVHAAWNALLKHPLDFMAEVFNFSKARGYQPQVMGRDYERALLEYQEIQGKKNGMQTEQAKQRVIKAAWNLIQDHEGLVLLDAMIAYLKSQSEKVAGLEEALEKYADANRARRQWASEVRQRREENIPELVDYQEWRERRMAMMIREEAELIYESSNQIMRQAIEANPKMSKNVRIYASRFQAVINNWSKVLGDFDKAAERIGDYFDYLRHPETIKLDNEDSTIKYTNLIGYNRAIEALHALVAQLHNEAASALVAAGVVSDRPKRVSFMATALHEKLTKQDSKEVHKEDANNLINRFLGDYTLTSLMPALWAIQNGLPVDHVDAAIRRWGVLVSHHFHLIQVDDRRGKQLPAQRDIADLSHNGGWFVDYNTSLILSPNGQSYVLIAKTDLAKKMPPGMDRGVSLLARSMPATDQQPPIEASILGAHIYGFEETFLRHGAQDVVFFGAATMGVPEDLNPLAVLDPNILLSDKYLTGLDLRGIGRGTSVALGDAAIRGTISGSRLVVSNLQGGHGAGPKPDNPYQVRPREAKVVVEELDPLTLPRGEAFETQGSLPVFSVRATGETQTWWERRKMGMELSASQMDKGQILRMVPKKGETKTSPTLQNPWGQNRMLFNRSSPLPMAARGALRGAGYARLPFIH